MPQIKDAAARPILRLGSQRRLIEDVGWPPIRLVLEMLWAGMANVVETPREAGVGNYSIIRHGLTLFGYFETDDLEQAICISSFPVLRLPRAPSSF
jgi:hypothetical protein